ncbi:MAG: RNA polymerase sigma factor [Nitrospirae bacterium]|nr:RNA polymerase sigma factor [Fimbriimonadaceae bacterium]
MDFERLAQRHKDAVYRQMVRVCGNHDDAEDALVQALLRAYEHASQLRDESAFRGWVSQIGRRICARMRHREELRPLSSLGDHDFAAEGPDPSLRAEQDHLVSCVKNAVGTLTAVYRPVYEMREIEGRTAEETAEALGLTVAAVKSRLHRARAIVRAYLDENACSP